MVVNREAVRAILLTPEREVLLLRVRPPGREDRFWIPPGGGREPNEIAEAALRRELMEEVGLEQFEMGPLVWRRHHTFDWAHKRISQREEYYIVSVPRFEPRMSDPVEAKLVDQLRWWPLTQLVHVQEPLTPRSLAQIVEKYLLQGPPCEPLQTEVVVD